MYKYLPKTIMIAAVIVLAAFAQDVTTFRDPRDGKAYKTVKIGSQVWFARNLDYAAQKSVCFDNKEANCAKYGRHYDWATAMGIDTSYNDSLWNGSDIKHQGICPVGWHIPSEDEWMTLIDYAGGEETAGAKLKSKTGWNNSNDAPPGFKPNPNAVNWKKGTDYYGFSALPGGLGDRRGGFGGIGIEGCWWSSTEKNQRMAYWYYMSCSDEGAYRSSSAKSDRYSVRCVRD